VPFLASNFIGAQRRWNWTLLGLGHTVFNLLFFKRLEIEPHDS
jgi:hypothetical protein